MGFFSKFSSKGQSGVVVAASPAPDASKLSLNETSAALPPATKIAVPVASQLASAAPAKSSLAKPAAQVGDLPVGWLERKDPK